MPKDDDLRAIKELLEIVKHKVDMLDISRSGQSATLHLMKDQQSVMNKKMDDMKETLDSNTGSLVEIELKLDSYADSYKMNKHNIERLDTRLNTVEDELTIEPPEDLKVSHFAE